eukprot:gnl/TRDRNA2_/TRDRNA2_151235_c0_seq2.p1 gnl/TRDRNA2_/TRDRNA2_151235_c0~~gnl/TRDRNA2_/TRDRNA2_151235_c0_seq2.p1  ORF type:complete len:191 (-),score=17.80 gnl/TRDRNA2_/TRDRNA2_151235_c0_seq2:33-605(-)
MPIKGAHWRSSKMLRRHGKDFEMSCNTNFIGHLRRCAAYHEARGGTWISERLIKLLAHIHRDPTNRIRMYSFELWDKTSGELAAASFGFALGAFFHDFSMCCLVKDRRATGAVLSKTIGAVLTDVGVLDWYWGCKCAYMAEYEAHGAKEISRSLYYRRIRHASAQELKCDPGDAIAQGNAPIAGRPCGII